MFVVMCRNMSAGIKPIKIFYDETEAEMYIEHSPERDYYADYWVEEVEIG